MDTAPPSEPLRPFPNLQSMLQHSGSLPAQPGSSLSCINWTLKDSCTLQTRSEGQRLENVLSLHHACTERGGCPGGVSGAISFVPTCCSPRDFHAFAHPPSHHIELARLSCFTLEPVAIRTHCARGSCTSSYEHDCQHQEDNSDKVPEDCDTPRCRPSGPHGKPSEGWVRAIPGEGPSPPPGSLPVRTRVLARTPMKTTPRQ